MYYAKLFIAFLCCAVSGLVQWREQAVPKVPPEDRTAWDPTKSWFHNMKNEWTESIRFNAEYWGKHLALIAVLFFILLGLNVYWVVT
ncbi:hypothetical protein [Aestuariivirga sp.]|uniref:hypothetical protein n=1 Tax=Aestuariivirga sp. TaxID=2650926 RepID=UPI0039E5C9BC